MIAVGLIADNLIPGAAITSSTQAPATIGYPVKEGSGSASMKVSGEYAGAADSELFVVEIDGVGAGKEIGQATYRWKRESDAAWQAAAQATSTAASALADGVKVRFIAGAGDDFQLGDLWKFRVVRFHGKLRLSDRDPNTEWRTGSLVGQEFVSADFGSSKVLNAVVLHGHNLTSAAVITLKGRTGADPDPVVGNMQMLQHNNSGIYDDKTLHLFADDGAYAQVWPNVVGRYGYVGATAPFGQLSVVDVSTAAVYTGAGAMNLVVEYWNGSAWAAVAGLSDGTVSGGDTFGQAGNVTWTIPGGWAAMNASDLNGSVFDGVAWAYARAGLYYVRLSLSPTAGKVVTTPGQADQIVPQGLTSPDWTEAVAWRAGTILHRTAGNRTARSVRLEIVDPANPDGYVALAELAVALETTFSSAILIDALERLREGNSVSATADSRSRRDKVYASREAVSLRLLVGNADFLALRAAFEGAYPVEGGMRPFPFFLDVDRGDGSADDFFLVLPAPGDGLKSGNFAGTGSDALHRVDFRARQIPLVKRA